jgi:4'-phosphopantetheinyl transferase
MPSSELPPPAPAAALPEPIGRQEVHLWYTLCRNVTDAALIQAYHDLMSPAERAQQARFVFAKDRHQYLVTRALVRTVLSRYVPEDPRAWSFRTNDYGRPEVAGPREVPIRFNLSHAGGMVVCLVALDRTIGVDVMRFLDHAPLEVADRFFAADETAELRSLPLAQQGRRFFEYWTLKESYIKARGMGLSLPLDQFSLHLGKPGPIRISFLPGIQDDPDPWQFNLLDLAEEYLVAVAIRRMDEPDLVILPRETIPLEPPGRMRR